VEHISGFDTDQLGTFTREIPRAGTQLEAARKKARLGMEFGSFSLGLASECSFGPDPMFGICAWNVETLIFVDDETGIEITGLAQGKAHHMHMTATDWMAAEDFAHQADCPRHHMVVRPDNAHHPRPHKGISTWAELEYAFDSALTQSVSRQVFLESNLRAYANPTRMSIMHLAAENLVAKLKSFCPACGSPGFWVIERIEGLLCEACGTPTRETRAEVHGCMKCAHRLIRESPTTLYADPARCDYCNP
jgi:hypothetical protein